MRRAYGDLVPGSVARQRAVEADLSWRHRDTEPVQRRLAEIAAEAVNAEVVNAPSNRRVRSRRRSRPLRGVVRATCANERCGKPFEYEWPVINRRYCSVRCRRSAARRGELREMAARWAALPADVMRARAEQVAQECWAAYARLTAPLAEQEVGR